MAVEGGPPRAPVQVVVVDDDDVSRRGMASLLGECPQVRVLAALSHTEALGWGDWCGVQVVLVDAADRRARDDHFPGVRVVEQIRLQRPRDEITVIVVTGHFFNDAVRRRMREAGADFFYHRSELADARVLYEVVLDPDPERGIPDPEDSEEEFRRGVTGSTRVNRAVAYAVEQGLPDVLAGRRQLPQRRLQRLRRDFNREARLNPITVDGLAPERVQEHPSLKQIGRFLAWAMKASSERPPRASPGADHDREDP